MSKLQGTSSVIAPISSRQETSGPSKTHVQPLQTNASNPWTLTLSPPCFRLFWISIILYHLFNAAFILVAAGLHIIASIPSVYEHLWLIQIPLATLSISGWTYLVFGVCHLLAVFANIFQSIQRHQLSFGHDDAPDQSRLASIQGPPDESAVRRRLTFIRIFMRTALAAPLDLWERYFGLYGFFGVHGSFFYVGFYARQSLEIVFQTYQAYTVSRAVPLPWINGFVVVMIVINCLYTPIVNISMKRHPAARRVVSLMVDVLVDFSIIVVVPVCIALPRILEFDWTIMQYPDTRKYNDKWLTTALSEARQVLVSSPLDYMSSMFPHLTGLAGLDTIKCIIMRAPESKRIAPKPIIPPFEAWVMEDDTRHRWITRTFKVFSVLWCILVVVLHILAQSHRGVSRSSCSLQLNAWLTSRYPCSIVEVNCYREECSGAPHEMTRELEDFERTTVTKIIFSHCHALHIPTIVTQFSQIRSLETFNSTLVEWPAEAAVTSESNPKLGYMNFIDTNFSTFPEGLRHGQLPVNMVFVIYHSNFSTFPPDIGDTWAGKTWMIFTVERSLLRELPASFKDVPCARLSLVDNHIEHLADDVLASQRSLTRIRLSGNPLRELPSQIGGTEALSLLVVENTNVTAAPAWYYEWVAASDQSGVGSISFSFRGSPVCTSRPTAKECQDLAEERLGAFPYDIIAAQHIL